jgi:integrase
LTGAPRGRLDLHGGRLRVGEAKTEAGLRDIELTFFLQAELREHVAHMAALGRPTSAGGPIFPTYRGGEHSASNIRNRLLAECVARANARREAEGKMLLPEKVTPHTLRRTFASLALDGGP